jgi:hypothetical protein
MLKHELGLKESAPKLNLPFFILNLSFHIVNRIGRFDFQGNRFTRQGLNENLHTAPEAQYKMQSGLLLDVVI